MITPAFLLLLAPALTLRADDQGLALATDRGPVATVAYRAAAGDQRLDSGPARLDGDRLTVDLRGPAGASLTGNVTQLARGVRVDWTISAPEGEWGGGLRQEFATEPDNAAVRPVTIWVKPTGTQPWEVVGDTPYPDTECQVRVLRFGDRALVMVCSSYDPDWFFGHLLSRTRTQKFAPPRDGAPGSMALAWLWVPAAETEPFDAAAADRFAAEAAGRPLALTVETGQLGNLFEPGQLVPLRLRASNVTDVEQAGTVYLAAYDYGGRTLAGEQVEILVPARQTQMVERQLNPASRGVVFVKAGVGWDGGRHDTRATIGILPTRKQSDTAPDSPFGMAAIIASPERYPNQFDDATVLAAMERIGVRWIRSGFYRLSDQPTADDRAATAARIDELKSFGILPHVQIGTRVPADEAEFAQRLRATVTTFGKLAPNLEVGNELNLGGLKADEYIDQILKPAVAATREKAPGTQVFSMGLGGVSKGWLDAFEAAGGMELVDVLSIHPGCHPRAPEFWQGWRGWVWRSQVQDALAAAKRAGKEVWITETYAPTPPRYNQVDQRTSADYLVRTYLCAIALGVQVCEWYQFQDGVWFAQRSRPDDTEYSFGIVYPDLTPKPAYVAYGAMTERLAGATCLGRLDLGADDLYGLRFRRGDQTVDVLWSYREKHECDLAWYPPEKFEGQHRKPMEPWVERWQEPVELSLPAGAQVTVTDLMGNATPTTPSDGKVSLSLTGSPVYVKGLGEVPLKDEFWGRMP